jgi:hypothetical protein
MKYGVVIIDLVLSGYTILSVHSDYKDAFRSSQQVH